MSGNNVVVICGTALLTGVLGAIVALALHGTIPGGDALTALGGVITLAGGIIAHALGVSAGAKAATTPSATLTAGKQ